MAIGNGDFLIARLQESGTVEVLVRIKEKSATSGRAPC